MWDRRYSREQGACKFWHSLDIPGTHGKGKNLNLYAVNSKLKNSKKILKNMIFLASKRLGCARRLQIFVIKLHARCSSKKNKIVHFSKFFSAPNFVFFFTSSYSVETQKKIARTLRTPASLMPKNFIFF